ncbi:hypothetical protein [Streptomyces subrutilus]|uniref:hypothetical protein n=1 Tax=Streptomyces subrutilus TaxID=36818 RepID=UPI00114D0730|nr:hypothetical protein [Streptomyces subrutilus]
MPDGAFADVDADGREGFASAFSFASSGPHPHVVSATHADTAATLTIVRVFIRSPPPADCPSRVTHDHAGRFPAPDPLLPKDLASLPRSRRFDLLRGYAA